MTINPNYDAENHEENLHSDDALTARTCESTPELHDFYYDSGFAAERAGELNLAVDLYKQAVQIQPDSAQAWYSYGDALLGLNRPEEAVKALRKAVELSPKTLLYHYDLGRALYDLGRHAEASSEFAPIVVTDPQLVRASSTLVLSAMTNLALSQAKLGLPTVAIRTLQPALSGAVDTLYNLGFLHVRAEQYAEALPFIEAAILLQPDSTEINHLLGSTLFKLNRRQDALEFLQKATKLDPGCAGAWYDLACLEAQEGRNDTAFLNLEQAIACGFKNITHLHRDADLYCLHRDAQWPKLLTKLGQFDKETR